jgi:hypothetical protein
VLDLAPRTTDGSVVAPAQAEEGWRACLTTHQSPKASRHAPKTAAKTIHQMDRFVLGNSALLKKSADTGVTFPACHA